MSENSRNIAHYQAMGEELLAEVSAIADTHSAVAAAYAGSARIHAEWVRRGSYGSEKAAAIEASLPAIQAANVRHSEVMVARAEARRAAAFGG